MENVSNVYDVAFPHLGIFIKNLKNTFNIGDFTIAYYGIIVAIAMLVGFLIVLKLAKIRKMKEETIYDIFILVIILGIIGARAYYVLFNFDYYSVRPEEILDIRGGGLAVFGGIILVTIGIIIYTKIRKHDLLSLLDIIVPGVAIGQAIGRWGNFFNMEAFGGYTDNLFAMQLNALNIDSNNMTFEQALNIIDTNSARYIQAHPTFLYESFLCIILFVILIVSFNKYYKFKGQLFATYLIGYGVIRFFIESLRTDSLMLFSFKISQIVSIIAIIIGIVMIIKNRKGTINIKVSKGKIEKKKDGRTTSLLKNMKEKNFSKFANLIFKSENENVKKKTNGASNRKKVAKKRDTNKKRSR